MFVEHVLAFTDRVKPLVMKLSQYSLECMPQEIIEDRRRYLTQMCIQNKC